MTASPLRIGLGASAAFRRDEASPLFGFLRDFAPFLAAGDVTLHAVGATHDAIAYGGILDPGSLIRLPPAREGGVIRLAAMVVPDMAGESGLDWVIYLLDPTDPITVFPEMQALKRQCVVHGTPFLTNRAAASEWCALAWSRRADPAGPELAGRIARWVRPDRLDREAIGLIAHDSQKRTMLEFARAHRAVLSRFGRRLATGTTGGLLNGEIPPRMAAEAETLRDLLPITPERWVTRYQSGPRGGDAQIAVEVLNGTCRRLVFFEDPHVAREHEADIQLLERATRFAPAGCLCVNDLASAELWIESLARLLQ